MGLLKQLVINPSATSTGAVCHRENHSWARGGLGSAPGTDRSGLSIQAEWRVVCQRDEKVAKCRSWTVCCVWPFPPGQGVALPRLCCLTMTCDPWPWPLQGPPCHLSFIFVVSVDTGETWTLWFLWLCTSATLWHLAAAPLFFHFWLFVTKWGTRCFQFPLMERHCHSCEQAAGLSG